jgi:hypothetical protein
MVFQVEVMEHWAIAYIGHLQTEVTVNNLFIWLNYLLFTVVFRTYMFVMVLEFGQFLVWNMLWYN